MFPYPLLTISLLGMWVLLNGVTIGQVLLGSIVAVCSTWALAALRPEKPKLRKWYLLPKLFGLVMLDIIRPAAVATARVTVPSQQARFAVARRGVLARIATNGPGLVRIRVSDARGRILARRTEAVFAAGTTSTRVTLTNAGKRVLRRARNLRVRVRFEFRDLLAGRDDGDVRTVMR